MTRAATLEEPDSRELIVRAALALFSEKGFDGSTTREIATRAGVNHGLIRYYFGGKLKLWQAAVDLAFADLGTGLADTRRESAAGGDDREKSGRLIRNYVHYVARHPEFVRLMHDEGKRRGPRMRWLVDRHVKPMFELVSKLVERSRGLGVFPEEMEPLHFHYILAGAVGVIFHQAEECKRLTGVDPFDEEVVERHARLVERMILGPPKEESSE